ncbi:MAG: insulinase family protein [Candidatus Shikimatogenerans sp. Tmey]
MKNNKISSKKKINIKLDISYKPIYILNNGVKIFLIKRDNESIVDIELKINHPYINNKYFSILKILFDDIIKLGNNNYSTQKINKILMENCADLNFNFKGFKLNVYKKNIKNIFSLINKIFIKSIFSNDKKFINILKKIIMYITLYKNNPKLIINNLRDKIYCNNFNDLFFLKKNINNIKLYKIKKIFKKYFIPNNAYLFFYGNISKNKVIILAKKYFSNWLYRTIPKNKKINNIFVKKKKNDIMFIDYPKFNNNIIIKLGNILNYQINNKIYIILLLIPYIFKNCKYKYFKNISINLYINKYLSYIDFTLYITNKNIYFIIKNIKKIIHEICLKKININILNLIKKKLINKLLIKYSNCYNLFKLIYNNYIYNFKNKFCVNIIKIINKITIYDIYKVLKIIFSKYYKNIIMANILNFYKEDILIDNIKINYLNIYGYNN